MRLFLAVNFTNETRAQLLALQDELRARSKRGRFSTPENLHLTLVFLGECDDKQSASAIAAMEAICFEPFPILVDKIGRFKREAGDIWWAGLQENEPLGKLQQNLTDELAAAGFKLERRKYSPHITLGRDVITDEIPWKTEPFGETVNSIDLMKSERIQGKLTYASIFSRK